jgi:Replication initiator protein, pSAM2
LTAAAIEDEVRSARVSNEEPGCGLADVRWGTQVQAEEISSADRRLCERKVGYLAKYAAKAAGSRPQAARGSYARHLRRLAATAAAFCTEGCPRGCRPGRVERCGWCRQRVRSYGYRGHVLTKGQKWGLTFRALRGRREDYCRTAAEEETRANVVRWAYAGRGWPMSQEGEETAKAAAIVGGVLRGAGGRAPDRAPPHRPQSHEIG